MSLLRAASKKEPGRVVAGSTVESRVQTVKVMQDCHLAACAYIPRDVSLGFWRRTGMISSRL